MIRLVNSVVLLFVFASFIGCGDDPSSVGSGILPDKVTISEFDSETDSVAVNSGNFTKTVSLNNSGILLVGRADGISASTLMRFDFSVFPYSTDLKNDSLTILSAEVRLTPFYSYGDTTAQVPIEVYKVLNNWSSGTITNDSIASLIVPRNNLVVPGTLTTSDSVYLFKISPELVREWLFAASDSSGFVDNGLMISSSTLASRIIGFRSYSSDVDIIPSIQIVLEKAGSYIDTVIYSLLEDIHIVEGGVLSLPANRLVARSGIVDFAKIAFDFSSLPTGSIINKAVLTVQIDTLNSKSGDSFTDGLVAYFMADSLSNQFETITSAKLIRSGSSFTGEVTNIITRMKFQANNQGMAISPGSQIEGIERFVFYSTTHPDTAFRPRLKIYYSVAE